MFDWIVAAIAQYGYLGIALLMFAENVFPPIPSELIMPFAGFVATRGQLDPVGVVAAGVAGSLALLLVWIYYSSMILLFGAEFTQVWADQRGAGVVPERGAVRAGQERPHPVGAR